MKPMKYPVLEPNLQIDFYNRLKSIRERYLLEGFRRTVKKLDIRTIDDQLAEYPNGKCIQKLAGFGLRGELFFPVPLIFQSNPYLLGYYRLLFGFSQKEWYYKGPFGKFKKMEEIGVIPSIVESDIHDLCLSLIGTAEILVMSLDELSVNTIHDLQLLTIGPMLRGGRNTDVGKSATDETFDLIKRLVKPYTKKYDDRRIELVNDSKRQILIEFSSDPDVRITEKMKSGTRPLVSIEIKGGTDVSNIHNRIGEAEKSHQKARNNGYFEFWTIIRVEMSYEVLKKESPTTTHFFNLTKIQDHRTDEYMKFRDLLSSVISIQIE